MGECEKKSEKIYQKVALINCELAYPMRFATYAPFELMHGRKSTLDELIARIKPFSRESIIHLCSAIGLILKFWDRNGWDPTYYQTLLRAFLSLSVRTGIALAHVQVSLKSCFIEGSCY